MSADSITPFTFESMAVRGALIHLSRAWRRMQRDQNYDALVAETLGQSAAATGLIAQSLKFDGEITLQLQGSKILQMLVRQCTDDLEAEVRVQAPTEADGTPLRMVASARVDPNEGSIFGAFSAILKGGH